MTGAVTRIFDASPSPEQYIILCDEEPDDPRVRRGYCFCGSPASLTRLNNDPIGRWTFNHGEVALVSTDELKLLIPNTVDRTTETFGAELLRDALAQLHSWWARPPIELHVFSRSVASSAEPSPASQD